MVQVRSVSPSTTPPGVLLQSRWALPFIGWVFWSLYICSVVASQVGLDAPSSTALCCMFSNSWRYGMTLVSYCIVNPSVFLVSLTRIVPAASLFIGKKDVMSLTDFWLIQIGQLIMEIGYGYHVHHSFIRYEPSNKYYAQVTSLVLLTSE